MVVIYNNGSQGVLALLYENELSPLVSVSGTAQGDPNTLVNPSKDLLWQSSNNDNSYLEFDFNKLHIRPRSYVFGGALTSAYASKWRMLGRNYVEEEWTLIHREDSGIIYCYPNTGTGGCNNLTRAYFEFNNTKYFRFIRWVGDEYRGLSYKMLSMKYIEIYERNDESIFFHSCYNIYQRYYVERYSIIFLIFFELIC